MVGKSFFNEILNQNGWWRWKGKEVYAVVLIWLHRIRINSRNCSEKPHPAIRTDLNFPISKLAWRRMNVNEVSCQQDMGAAAKPLDNGSHSATNIQFLFNKGSGHKPKRSNRTLKDADSRTRCKQTQFHWTCIFYPAVTNKTTIKAFFCVIDCIYSNKREKQVGQCRYIADWQ